jgi:hypothetical protein
MMRITLRTIALVSLVATVPGCRSRRAPPPPAPVASASAAPLDIAGSIYGSPREAHPLAVRLCDALHALPGRRIAECCGTPPSRFVFDECVRVVSASLESGASALAERRVDACTRAAEASLAGCDWVTPSEPLSPAACQSIFEGRVREGGVCRSSLECADDLHCQGLSATRTGVCTRPQAIGSACGSHVDVMAAYVLDRGLDRARPFCRDFCSLVNHRCEPIPAEGASCLASVNCAPGHACIASRCSSSAPIATLATPGQSCHTDFDCQQGGCIEGMCGKKCSMSFGALSNAKPMRLPARPPRD